MIKKALICDWLNVYAGAERCVESFTNIWADFEIYSLIDFLNDTDRYGILKNKHAHTSFIQNLPLAKSRYRDYLPLFPYAIENFNLSEYDLILSSSHAVAKGVLTHSDQLHISYVHTPIRYAWDLYFEYLKNSGLNSGLKGFFAKYFLHKIRIWDLISTNRVDYFIANSRYIASRIKKIYGRASDVIYPPVDTDKFEAKENKDEFYYLFIYEKAIRQIISDYKLRNRKDLVRDIAFLIKKPIFQLIEREKIDIIIPVPISKEREIERGFNQIEYLLECLDIKYKKIERTKNTKHMYTLKDNEKKEKNVESAFKNNLNLKNKNVLIVDDIVTSGATINSISEELRKDNDNINIKIFSIAIARHFIKE